MTVRAKTDHRNKNKQRLQLLRQWKIVYPRRIKKKLVVPIYDAVLWLVVDDNIAKERKKLEHVFGPAPDNDNYDALCSYSGGHTFALFFAREQMTIKIISHEVFHLTHRIMDWVGANFDDSHHEQGALLHSYIMDVVCGALGGKESNDKPKRNDGNNRNRSPRSHNRF